MRPGGGEEGAEGWGEPWRVSEVGARRWQRLRRAKAQKAEGGERLQR